MDIPAIASNVSARVLARVAEKSPYGRKWIRNSGLNNKGSIANFIRPVFQHNEHELVNCDGVNFSIDLNDQVQRLIYFGAYDKSDLQRVLPLVPRTGALCLDIGANVGYYSLHLAKHITAGKIYAFECDPTNFSRLRNNIRVNDFSRVIEAHEIAISDKVGISVFHRSDAAHSGWGSLSEFADIANSRVEVSTVTLDHFLASRAINTVDFMKVDVEAHEFELLEGAKDSLARHVFKYIWIEFNGPRLAERGRSFDQFCTLFARYGYRPVTANVHLADLLRQAESETGSLCANFLFAPQGARA